ncbi:MULTISPECIES: TetR/AcrR family transcriptional regulator [unclassified Brevibacterium]|uniref:TetR/AcrR family transcriptional regulator n=1 Tax=unclassified Brevibacterium TaxID=2614124 RepID=UPI000C607FB3|nr:MULTISPECIES: TetR/AcrR family transcriptional regulator [unclassified Brevibacterium]SMX70066.1 transcriptional regulator, TetR family [Brevibacterium sp. 239c]
MTSETQDVNAVVRGARAEYREKQIVEAAVSLMQTKGSHAVSMQAIAKSAGVSVGLLYKYFSDREQILLAAITRVLEGFRVRVPAAIEASEDPVHRIIAAFTEFCQVVDEHRQAVVLTYQTSRSLSRDGLASIQSQELATLQPLIDVVGEAVDKGDLYEVDAGTLGHDLMALAHMWALKHWYFQQTQVSLSQYIDRQVRTVVLSNLSTSARKRVNLN